MTALAATIGGSKLTLQPVLPKGLKITTFARFEAEHPDLPTTQGSAARRLDEQPKPRQRPSIARSAPRRHASPAAVSALRSKPSSTPSSPRASRPQLGCSSYSAAQPQAPMPRTKSVPAFVKGGMSARQSTERLPRVASQGKAPASSRTVMAPRVRTRSAERPVLDPSPRLTRQRTGETPPTSEREASEREASEREASEHEASGREASPPPVRRTDLSKDMGAVSFTGPPATAAAAPWARRPSPTRLSLDLPSRGHAVTPARETPAPSSTPIASPRASGPARVSGLP